MLPLLSALLPWQRWGKCTPFLPLAQAWGGRGWWRGKRRRGGRRAVKGRRLRGWRGRGAGWGRVWDSGQLFLTNWWRGRRRVQGVVVVVTAGDHNCPRFHQTDSSFAQQLEELRGQKVSCTRARRLSCTTLLLCRWLAEEQRRRWRLLHHTLHPLPPHLPLCQPGEGAALQDIQKLRLFLHGGDKGETKWWKRIQLAGTKNVSNRLQLLLGKSICQKHQMPLQSTERRRVGVTLRVREQRRQPLLSAWLTSAQGGGRVCLAPPASDPNISCKSSYHASNSAPHSGATPGGYIHSAVISTNQLLRTDTTTQHAPTPSTPDLAQKIIEVFFYAKEKKKKKSHIVYLHQNSTHGVVQLC